MCEGEFGMKKLLSQSANHLPLVMIADSDDEERGFLKEVLKLEGFKVIEATDGQEALNLAIRFTPDLLLLDLSLPLISGTTVLRHIRNQARFKSLPIITVCFPSSNGKRALLPGANAQFEKPVDLRQFFSELDRRFPRRAIAV
jgi:DNA-binding response OmpR family regulator